MCYIVLWVLVLLVLLVLFELQDLKRIISAEITRSSPSLGRTSSASNLKKGLPAPPLSQAYMAHEGGPTAWVWLFPFSTDPKSRSFYRAAPGKIGATCLTRKGPNGVSTNGVTATSMFLMSLQIPCFCWSGADLASSFTMCLTCEVLHGMFPWRTRYPLS